MIQGHIIILSVHYPAVSLQDQRGPKSPKLVGGFASIQGSKDLAREKIKKVPVEGRTGVGRGADRSCMQAEKRVFRQRCWTVRPDPSMTRDFD